MLFCFTKPNCSMPQFCLSSISGTSLPCPLHGAERRSIPALGRQDRLGKRSEWFPLGGTGTKIEDRLVVSALGRDLPPSCTCWDEARGRQRSNQGASMAIDLSLVQKSHLKGKLINGKHGLVTLPLSFPFSGAHYTPNLLESGWYRSCWGKTFLWI